MSKLYRKRPKTWNFDRVKAPGFADRKRAHIANIMLFAIDEPRELSRRSKSKSLSASGIFAFLLLFVPFLGEAGTNDGSILLLNDSAFILTATIQASDGTFLGQFTIQPGQQRNFTTHLNPTSYVHPGAPRTSLTPYMVIWQCPSEGTYSMCPTVSPGALCKANDCPGSHFCSPKPEIKKEPPASTLKTTK